MANEERSPSDELEGDELDGDELEAGLDPAFDALMREVAEAPRIAPDLLQTVNLDQAVAAGWPVMRLLPKQTEVIDNRYLIQSELGRGGMGVVFAARNLRTQRDVALKWMLPRAFSRSTKERDERIARFVREAQAVSRVDHPNVVRVLDVGGDPEAPYLVMERLEGETLRTRLTRSPLSWDEALLLLVPVLEGVAAAHRAGVIHRDLKPDNIFLCTSGVKVLDFGVSRIGGDEPHVTLTRTGTMLGTPAYMPLEQLRGHREVDERTDVYALGVILYEALSGRLPFDAQTSADQAVLLATSSPTDLAELCPQLRGPRSVAVMKALSREAATRYPTIDAMRRALTEASKPQPTAWGGARTVLGLVIFAVILAALATWRRSAPDHTRSARQREATLPGPSSFAKPEVAAPHVEASEPSEVSPSPPPAAQTTPARAAPAAAPALKAKRKPPQPPPSPTEPDTARRVDDVGPAQPQASRPNLPTSLSAEHFRASNAKPEATEDRRPSVPASPADKSPSLDRSQF